MDNRDAEGLPVLALLPCGEPKCFLQQQQNSSRRAICSLTSRAKSGNWDLCCFASLPSSLSLVLLYDGHAFSLQQISAASAACGNLAVLHKLCFKTGERSPAQVLVPSAHWQAAVQGCSTLVVRQERQQQPRKQCKLNGPGTSTWPLRSITASMYPLKCEQMQAQCIALQACGIIDQR